MHMLAVTVDRPRAQNSGGFKVIRSSANTQNKEKRRKQGDKKRKEKEMRREEKNLKQNIPAVSFPLS